jgi:hypothetical protein
MFPLRILRASISLFLHEGFDCRNGTSIWGTELTKVKFSAKNTSAANSDLCAAACLQNPCCKGYYYKVRTGLPPGTHAGTRSWEISHIIACGSSMLCR